MEFNLLPAEAQSTVSIDGLGVESFEVGTGTATSDYYLVLGQAKGQVAGRLEYNAELFNHETAQLMASEWQVRDLPWCNLHLTQLKSRSRHAYFCGLLHASRGTVNVDFAPVWYKRKVAFW